MQTKLKLVKINVFVAFIILLLQGCGEQSKYVKKSPAAPLAELNNEKISDEAKAPDEVTDKKVLSYWFIQSGCSTEKHDFPSNETLCKGLQDRDLNKDCALDLRKKKFIASDCIGEFKEFSSNKNLNTNGLSPIQCTGHVSGSSGEKKIDQTIQWDRKKFQKIVLSEFSDLKDAGEYSVNLIPNEDPTQPGTIKIFGWFIDNIKNQSVDGQLDSEVFFKHKEAQLNGRDVEITCKLVNQDLQVPNYTNEPRLEMTCLGSKGPIQGKKENLLAHFFWDQKTELTEELKIQKDGQAVPSNIKLNIDLNKKTGTPVLKLISKENDQSVEVIGEVKGRLELTINYMSARDNQLIDISCVPTKVFNESIKKALESKNNGTKK